MRINTEKRKMLRGEPAFGYSLGIHSRDQASYEPHRRAIERLVQACRNTGKIPGFASDTPDQALDRVKQGFQFLTSGSDSGFMLEGARAGVAKMLGGRR
jgi:4-hydroxy-2-oxoheptanedioate aldolase